jgi:ectoine hydroxylase-related dioxygenase (phytanoyl-CoA dioxygenase family)
MTVPVTNLPELASGYAISAEQRAEFASNGHILLRGVATPEEAAAYHPVLAGAVARFNTEMRPLAERDTYGRAFLQVMNLWVRDEAVRRFVLARRFAGVAAALMGVSGVRIYHDQALFKEPGGGITPWHQDQYYWPLDTDHTVTMWMPLVDITANMGTLVFASRSGEGGYLGKLPISDQSESSFSRYIAEHGFPLVQAAAMTAGDATFHSGWVLHSAPGNDSSQARDVMTVIYFADGAHVTTPDNPNRERDLGRWLPGLQPGDLAASDLNPLVYHE